jgi:hypothetical protein
MKISKNSKLLMSFFLKNNYINHNKQTKKTNIILLELYNELIKAYNFLLTTKKTTGDSLYNINISKITSISQIPKPKNFNSKSFPNEIRKCIDDMSNLVISYTFSLFNRNINLFFIVEKQEDINVYNKYVDAIVMWLYVLNEYASSRCSKTFTVYLYFTNLEKKLPNTSISILDENNVNTAFTTTCPLDSEIVVFRREEWFKVFIHETFHNFALDFSDMNNFECHNHILSIFPVKSSVNLYESYTEFWAEIVNTLFCSFFSLKNKNNVQEFMKNAEYLIRFERTYSFFQLVKTLDFMGLKYTDLYSKSEHSVMLRNNLYKENTNVLAYYVIKTILLNNYQSFLSWCKNNNLSLLQFKKTIPNQRSFCLFIEKNYKTKMMLDAVRSSDFFLQILKGYNRTKHVNYLLNNMRMTICELV